VTSLLLVFSTSTTALIRCADSSTLTGLTENEPARASMPYTAMTMSIVISIRCDTMVIVRMRSARYETQ